jgi:hypothetical protein
VQHGLGSNPHDFIILPFRESFHKSLFVPVGEAFYNFAFCFLPRLPLFPAQRWIALFLPLSCSCFSMPSASRYLCIGATDPSGWDRKLGFIQYNGGLQIHNSLLTVVLHD